MTLDDAQARIAMLVEALERWVRDVNGDDCDVYGEGTCAGRGIDPVNMCRICHSRAALAATAEQVAAWRASVESAARADEQASLKSFHAAWKAEVRTKALRDAAAHFRTVPHHVAAHDAHQGLVSFGHSAADVLDALTAAEPTPNDEAFYRVGQTGVERALPVADASSIMGAVERAPAAKPEVCALGCNGYDRPGKPCVWPDCGGTGRAR
jgi:hypothetical protein